MFKSETPIRVRYAETDRMGFVYYGHYATYFEVARVESLRQMGVSYKDMEDRGILLPVLDYAVKFIKPALYDDLLSIHTMIQKMPAARICFEYETYNQAGELLNKASATLVFVKKATRKPCEAPDFFIEHFKPFFS